MVLFIISKNYNMRLNYQEQLAKIYEYPYFQKEVPSAFPYQKRLPPRYGQETASLFHTNCKVTKRRVCTCSHGPIKTMDDIAGSQDNAIKSIADDLGLYFEGYTPDATQNMNETVCV